MVKPYEEVMRRKTSPQVRWMFCSRGHRGRGVHTNNEGKGLIAQVACLAQVETPLPKGKGATSQRGKFGGGSAKSLQSRPVPANNQDMGKYGGRIETKATARGRH